MERSEKGLRLPGTHMGRFQVDDFSNQFPEEKKEEERRKESSHGQSPHGPHLGEKKKFFRGEKCTECLCQLHIPLDTNL